MKYLLASGNEVGKVVESIHEVPQCSGLYNWVNVFEGSIADYNKVKNRLEEFDVVHINMVPSNTGAIIDAHNRLKGSSTKLVLNNDYLPEVWSGWNQEPLLYYNLQKLGDCVFGTEPIQTSLMVDKAVCMPHPTNTKHLKRFTPKSNGNELGVVYNVYDRNLYHTSLMTQRLRDDFGYKASLINYFVKNKLHGACKNCFDSIHGFVPFKEWIMRLCTFKNVYMPHLYSAYNRAGVETAGLGLPVVGSNRGYSLNICYPDTVCDPLDYRRTRELFKKLEVQKFRDHVREQALEKCEFFNYEKSKERFNKMLEGCEK